MSIILLVTDSVENNSNYSQLYTININLDFEYVKINFSSQLFLVMNMLCQKWQKIKDATL